MDGRDNEQTFAFINIDSDNNKLNEMGHFLVYHIHDDIKFVHVLPY